VASAVEMVTGLAQQLKAEQKTLAKLGKNMAKPVGAAFKSRLAKDVAEAVRNVEASATAARAERVATAESAQQRITDQAVALAIQNVIRRGDARAGSAVQPVLT
jgi:type IV secretory pathway TrbL component